MQFPNAWHLIQSQLLIKQLDVLRNVNESRMRIYEDVDRNSQVLEKKNEDLLQDVKTCTQKIQEYV